MSPEAEPREYSRAFERLVQDNEDLTGLLAYALYKKAIREAAAQGRVVHSSENRSPTDTEVGAYRTAAEGMLSAFADSIVEQSRSDIVDTAVRTDIGRLESKLLREIQKSTTWWTAVTTNLVAWLLSIAITFLVVVAGVPNWITALVAKIARPDGG